MDLATLTPGQMEALAAVLAAAIAAGARMEAAGLAFDASVDLDGEFATVVFGWPCDGSVRIEVGSGAPLALPAPDREGA